MKVCLDHGKEVPFRSNAEINRCRPYCIFLRKQSLCHFLSMFTTSLHENWFIFLCEWDWLNWLKQLSMWRFSVQINVSKSVIAGTEAIWDCVIGWGSATMISRSDELWAAEWAIGPSACKLWPGPGAEDHYITTIPARDRESKHYSAMPTSAARADHTI